MKTIIRILFLSLPILTMGQPPPPTTATLIVNKTTGAITAPVNAATFAAANGLGGGGSSANPTATISSTVGSFVNGSANTFMRSDAAPTLPATITGFNSITAGAATDLTLTAGSGNQWLNLVTTGTGHVAIGAHPSPYINEVDTVFTAVGSLRINGAASSFGIGSAPEGGRILTLDGTPNYAFNGFEVALDIHPTLFAIANSDELYGIWVEPAYNDAGKSGVVHGGIMNKAPLRQDGTSVFNNTLWQKGLNTLISFSASAIQSDSILQVGGDVTGPGYDLGSAAGGLTGEYVAPSLGNSAGAGNAAPYNTGLAIRVNSIAAAANVVTDQIGLQVGVGRKDSNTTITNKYGIKVLDPATSSAGGTLNIGIYNGGTLSQIGAATLSGNLTVNGSTTALAGNLTVSGTGLSSTGGDFTAAGYFRTVKAYLGTANYAPDTLVSTQSEVFASTTLGAVVAGYGTTNDVSLLNRNGVTALSVAAATTNVTVAGNFTVSGAGTHSFAGTISAALGSSTATTQSAGDNSTKVATTAYADTAALASHLGTFASPNTAAGSITWTAPVYNIYTSAASTRTYTLPAASTYVNRAFILNVAVGTGHVNVQPASGAALVLAGVLLTADHYVQAATSAPGNYICFISDGTNWTSLGSSGTWADAASP